MTKKAVYCPGDTVITGTDYTQPGHPRGVHEDGSLCDHTGGVRIGDAPAPPEGPGGWHYVIRVSPEGRPDPEAGPDGPMTLGEATARETGPDPVSGWRSIAVGAITATG